MIIDKFNKHFPRYYANPFKHDEFSSFSYVDQSTLCEDIPGIQNHVIYWFDADFDINNYKSMVVKIYNMNNSTNEPNAQVINFNGNVKLITDINEANDIQINYFGVLHTKEYRCGIIVHRNYANMFMHAEYKSSGYSITGKANRIYSRLSGEIELWSSKPTDASSLEKRTSGNSYDGCFLRDSYNPNYYISSNAKFINAMKREHSYTCNEIYSTNSTINQQKIFNVVRRLNGPAYDDTVTTGYARYEYRSACTGGPWCYLETRTPESLNTYFRKELYSFSSLIIDKPASVNNSNEFIPIHGTLNYTINNGAKYVYKKRAILSIKKDLFSLSNQYPDLFIRLNNSSIYTDRTCRFPYLPSNDRINIDINWSISGGVAEKTVGGDYVYWPGEKGRLNSSTITFNRNTTLESSNSFEYNPDSYGVYNKESNTFEMANNTFRLYFIRE